MKSSAPADAPSFRNRSVVEMLIQMIEARVKRPVLVAEASR